MGFLGVLGVSGVRGARRLAAGLERGFKRVKQEEGTNDAVTDAPPPAPSAGNTITRHDVVHYLASRQRFSKLLF